jgi:hypothetical protein
MTSCVHGSKPISYAFELHSRQGGNSNLTAIGKEGKDL